MHFKIVVINNRSEVKGVQFWIEYKDNTRGEKIMSKDPYYFYELRGGGGVRCGLYYNSSLEKNY